MCRKFVFLVIKVSPGSFLSQEAVVDPKTDDRRTPLFYAADYGAVDVVKLLMERGADVTIRDIELQSVLHAAVGHPRAMEILLQVGTDKHPTEHEDDFFAIFLPKNYQYCSHSFT